MIKKSYYFLFVIIMAVVFSCKVKKDIPKVENRIETTTLNSWNAIVSQNIDYEWFHAKGDVLVDFEGTIIGARADIRVKKDSVIWISVKKFGFELARALITQDSVIALNRIQGYYISSSLDSLSSMIDLPVGFAEMQEIAVGNHLIVDQKPVSSKETDRGVVLNSQNDHFGVEYLLGDDYQVIETIVRDPEGRSIQALFAPYKDFGSGLMMSPERSFYYPNMENPSYSFKFSLEKIEIDKAKKIEFEIPPGYTKA